MPPYEIDDIRELPAFNYEGPCHESIFINIAHYYSPLYYINITALSLPFFKPLSSKNISKFNKFNLNILAKALLEKVKCPFGDKPMVMEGLSMLYAYCPYKIDLSRYPG